MPTVLVVDDSVFARVVFQQAWAARGWRVAWARDGAQALAGWRGERPDLVTMDVEMPGWDGVETVRRLRADGYRGPLVMLSAQGQAPLTLAALGAGADDFVLKPARREEVAAVVAAIERQWRPCPGGDAGQLVTAAGDGPPTDPAAVRLWLLIASTGGPKALEELLTGAPRPPSPVVVVQHMPAGFTAAFADRLSGCAGWAVREAPADGSARSLGDAPAWLAAGGRHLRLSRSALWTEEGPRVHGVVPAADVTLADAVAAFGGRLAIVILTGMGDDGAEGAARAHRLGAVVVVESQKTAVVWGMPRAAVERGAADAVLDRPRLRHWLHREWLRPRGRSGEAGEAGGAGKSGKAGKP